MPAFRLHSFTEYYKHQGVGKSNKDCKIDSSLYNLLQSQVRDKVDLNVLSLQLQLSELREMMAKKEREREEVGTRLIISTKVAQKLEKLPTEMKCLSEESLPPSKPLPKPRKNLSKESPPLSKPLPLTKPLPPPKLLPLPLPKPLLPPKPLPKPVKSLSKEQPTLNPVKNLSTEFLKQPHSQLPAPELAHTQETSVGTPSPGIMALLHETTQDIWSATALSKEQPPPKPLPKPVKNLGTDPKQPLPQLPAPELAHTQETSVGTPSPETMNNGVTQ